MSTLPLQMQMKPTSMSSHRISKCLMANPQKVRSASKNTWPNARNCGSTNSETPNLEKVASLHQLPHSWQAGSTHIAEGFHSSLSTVMKGLTTTTNISSEPVTR